MIYLSFDVEPDAPPYQSSSHRGSLEGLRWILDTLAKARVKATFFVVGKTAEAYPWIPESILEYGHELGSHGYSHKRLDHMPYHDAVEDIRRGLRVLREYADVKVFRAPNLQLPHSLLPVLRDAGIEVDSSLATYKGAKPEIVEEEGVVRVPVTVTSSFIRLIPRIFWGRFIEKRLVSIFFHPWEFSRIQRKPIWRPDIWWGTGDRARRAFTALLERIGGETRVIGEARVIIQEGLKNGWP